MFGMGMNDMFFGALALMVLIVVFVIVTKAFSAGRRRRRTELTEEDIRRILKAVEDKENDKL